MSFGGSRRRYPALSCAEVKSILKALGFSPRKNNNGSHESWVREETDTRKFAKVTVDCPKAPFSVNLIKSMISQANSDREKFYGATTKTAKKIQKKSKKKLKNNAKTKKRQLASVPRMNKNK